MEVVESKSECQQQNRRLTSQLTLLYITTEKKDFFQPYSKKKFCLIYKFRHSAQNSALIFVDHDIKLHFPSCISQNAVYRLIGHSFSGCYLAQSDLFIG